MHVCFRACLYAWACAGGCARELCTIMSSPKVQRPDNVNIMFQMEGSGAHICVQAPPVRSSSTRYVLCGSSHTLCSRTQLGCSHPCRSSPLANVHIAYTHKRAGNSCSEEKHTLNFACMHRVQPAHASEAQNRYLYLFHRHDLPVQKFFLVLWVLPNEGCKMRITERSLCLCSDA